MAFDVHPSFHIRILNYMQQVLTLAVVEDTKQHVSIDQSMVRDWKCSIYKIKIKFEVLNYHCLTKEGRGHYGFYILPRFSVN